MRKTEKNYQSGTEKNISTDSKTVLGQDRGNQSEPTGTIFVLQT